MEKKRKTGSKLSIKKEKHRKHKTLENNQKEEPKQEKKM